MAKTPTLKRLKTLIEESSDNIQALQINSFEMKKAFLAF
jgi:hypothetical protein